MSKSNASFLKNISFGVLANVISYATSFVSIMYICRIMKPSLYGNITFAISISGYFVLFASLGLPIYAMRACANCKDNKAKLNEVFSELFSLNIFLSLVSFASLTFLCFIIPIFRENRNLIMIFGLTILLNSVGCEWLYKGLEKFKYLAISSIITKLIALVAVFIFVKEPNDIYIYAFISIFSSCGTYLLNFILLRKYVSIRLNPKINFGLLKPVLVFFFMACAVSIYNNLDIAMLRIMKTSYETGLYGVASRSKQVLAGFGGIVWTVALPMSVKAWNDKNRDAFETYIQKSLSLVFLINISLLVYSFIFAKEFVLLMGGSDYAGAVNSFRITVLSIMPIGLSNILGGQILIPTLNERKLLLAEIVGALVNFALNLLVIPFFSINGAAATTLLAEFIVWAICLYYCRKRLNFKHSVLLPKKTLPCLLAAILSGILTYAMFICLKTHMTSILAMLFNNNIISEMALIFITFILYYSVFIIVAGLLGDPFSRNILHIIRRKLKNTFLHLNSIFINKSKSVYCPCCGLNLKNFKEGDFKKRPDVYNAERYSHTAQNVICPFCNSLPRHRILVSWLNDNKDTLQNRKMLYFAIEESVFLWLKKNHIPVTTADLYDNADLTLDITDIALPDNSYDIIICNHVLEHVTSYQKALAQLQRILTPNGMLILSFPIDNKYETIFEDDTIQAPQERVKMFGQRDHLRVFGRNSKTLLEQYGFCVDIIDGKRYDNRIRPVVGPADYDANYLFILKKNPSN